MDNSAPQDSQWHNYTGVGIGRTIWNKDARLSCGYEFNAIRDGNHSDRAIALAPK